MLANLAYRYLLSALWIAWLVYWWISARDVKCTMRSEPLRSRLLHIVPLSIAAILLIGVSARASWFTRRLIPWAPWQFWVAALVTAAGLLFTVWARMHLGRNWSGLVTIKEDHELVTSGPYAWVRHPIYTGLLAAFIACGFARGDWRGVVAVAIAIAALWRKLRLEEQWMRERFGESYAAYARRVPALVPFWRSKPRI